MNPAVPGGPYGVVPDAEVQRGAVVVPTASCPNTDEALKRPESPQYAYCRLFRTDCSGFVHVEHVDPNVGGAARVTCKYARPAKASSSPKVANAAELVPVGHHLPKALRKDVIEAFMDHASVGAEFRAYVLSVPANRQILVKAGGLTQSEVNLPPASMAIVLRSRLTAEVLSALSMCVVPKAALAGLVARRVLREAGVTVSSETPVKASLATLLQRASDIFCPITTAELIHGDSEHLKNVAARIRAGA